MLLGNCPASRRPVLDLLDPDESPDHDPAPLALIPLEPIAESEAGTEFAVTPPWDKHVWLDPEYEGTD